MLLSDLWWVMHLLVGPDLLLQTLIFTADGLVSRHCASSSRSLLIFLLWYSRSSGDRCMCVCVLIGSWLLPTQDWRAERSMHWYLAEDICLVPQRLTPPAVPLPLVAGWGWGQRNIQCLFALLSLSGPQYVSSQCQTKAITTHIVYTSWWVTYNI